MQSTGEEEQQLYSESLCESTNQFFLICFWHLCKRFCLSFGRRRLLRTHTVFQTKNRRFIDVVFQQVMSSTNFQPPKDSWDKCHRKIFTLYTLYSKKQTEHKRKTSVHPIGHFRNWPHAHKIEICWKSDQVLSNFQLNLSIFEVIPLN